MRGKETLLKLLPQTDKRERGLKAIYRQKALKHGSISVPRTQARVSQGMSAVKTVCQILVQNPRREGLAEHSLLWALRVLFSPLRSSLPSVVGGNWPGYPFHFHAWHSLPQSPSFPRPSGAGRDLLQR